MTTENITQDVLWFTIASNLASFSLGMLLVVIQFDVIGLIHNIEIYLLPGIVFGLGAFFYWGYKLWQNMDYLRRQSK